ncbi:UNVERIFIED_CONTAM: immunity protein 42 of polymorphic toxin system [Acetivibrio alkalicellulosi]
MMIGDPYKFSIIINTIDEWNIDGTWCNGVLLFCVDGNFFPKEVVSATLKTEVPLLKKNLKNLTIDEELYNMQKDKAFVEIYNITFPFDTHIDNDYRFDISPLSFSDSNCYVFAISNGKQVRIMASKLNYIIKDSRHDLKSINVNETFIDISELNKIISEIDIF